MVILHVITDLRTGGAEIQLKQLVLGSDPSRFRHVVVSLVDGGPLATELRTAGVEVHSLGMKRGLSSLLGIGRLLILLRRIKPDVLHGWLYHGCLISMLGIGLAGVPHLIWGIRSANPQLQGYGFITRRVVYLCAKLSRFPDMIIVNSEAGRIAHQGLGYDTTKMTVIPNGVDVELYHPDTGARGAIREELALSHDTLLIGMFARYSPMKDHDTFLRAVSLVHARHPQVHFLLAGKGVDMNNNHLSQLLRRNRIHNVVHLLGIRRDMPRLTAALDIACLSSWSESFPNVIAEAMSCAIPCVATDVGDVAKIVGREGRVVPARTPQALADSLFQLVELDPVERQKLGYQGRQRMCSEFSVGQALRLYDSTYENFRGYGELGAARSMAS